MSKPSDQSKPRVRLRDGEANPIHPVTADWNRNRDASRPELLPSSCPTRSGVELSALIDFSLLNDVFENFLEVTGLSIAVIDLEGKVLASSRWKRLCMEFHRANPLTLAGCIKSDTVLSQQMLDSSGIAIYRCANGLTDCATRLTIDGVHVANLFTGQFLLAPPDLDDFKRRQVACGFDEAAYFKALAEIPIVAEQRVPTILKLLRGLAEQITQQNLTEKLTLSALASVEQLVAERTESLVASEDRFRILFERAPVGQLLIASDSLRILECNQAAADIHGYSREELCQLRITDLVVGPDDESLRRIQERLENKEQVQFDVRARHRDGEPRHVAVSAEILISPSGKHIHATHLDITAQKQAEREQKRLHRALRLLSDSNMALVRAKNESELLNDLCRLVVESGGYRMAWVGLARHDAAKSVTPVAQWGYEEGYMERLRVSWDEALDIGRGPTGSAIRSCCTQVNQDYLNNANMAPWREAAMQRGYQSGVALPLMLDEQAFAVLTIYSADRRAFGAEEVALLEELASNVSYGLQSLRLRDELELYRSHLATLVEERTNEIANLNVKLMARAKEAESANRAKTTFLATMSHEIRTPLNAVLGLTGLLADSPLNRRQRDYADKIQLSAHALRALIDDVLDFSKIEAGALQLEQAPFSLSAILRTAAAVVSANTRTKPIETLFDVAPDIPDALIGDALRLQQILLNLTGNAAKFTEAGAIIVSVRRLSAESGSVTLEFAVRDTGIGIPPEHLGQIFAEFAQADSSTSRKFGGAGLGLAICARLTELMGGTIDVESAERWGSEFRVRLPLTVADGDVIAPADEELSGLRILIVDDHPLAREVLLRTCAALNWQAAAVDSAMAGLDELRHSAAEGREYDLLLLDWRMPDMDGLQMLQQARMAPRVSLPLVILMVSTFELEQAAADSEDLFLDGILAKPTTPAALLDAVKRAHTGEPAVELNPAAMDRRLAGMRLLVAEDNELNQQVIEQILTRAGAEVVIVPHGLAAVDAVRHPNAHFTAVLMDIQMPVMDGYTATQMIREDLGRRDLPIIAVTAGTQIEDRKKSRDAGMAGHIVKPIDLEALLTILVKQRKDSPPEAGEEAWPSMNANATADLPGLDVAAALRTFGGDKEKYISLLRRFATRHGADPAEIRRLWDARDSQGAAQRLHELCGVAGFLAVTDLARLTSATETAIYAGNRNTVPDLLDVLDVAMGVLLESIDQFEAMSTRDEQDFRPADTPRINHLNS